MVQFNEGPTRSFKAGADLSASQFCAAKLDTTTENQVLLAGTSTDPICGILDKFAVNGKQNDIVQVRKGGFSGRLIMSAACNIGDLITATTGGKGVASTTNKDFIIGRALQAAAANGDIIEVELIMGYLSS